MIEDQATKTQEQTAATKAPKTLRRGTSAPFFAAGDFPGSGFDGSAIFSGATGAPSAFARASLIISAADLPAALAASTFAAGFAAAAAALPSEGVAAGTAPAFARIAARMSAGLFGAAPTAGVAAAAPAGFFAAARIAAVPVGAAGGFAFARAAAMMSAVLFGAEAGEPTAVVSADIELAGGVAVDSTDTGGSEVAAASEGDADAAFARIFARMSFVEGFGSVIQPASHRKRSCRDVKPCSSPLDNCCR